MNKKKVVIILLIVAIIAGGGFFAYKYFIQKDEMKKIPSTYEDLQWGASYDDVYGNACARGEKIKKEQELKDTKCLVTSRDGYEKIDGEIKVIYLIDKSTGLKDVAIYFEKENCKQGLDKIFNSYKKRLDKYCTPCKDYDCFWENSDGISYTLMDCDDHIIYSISKK